jgi:serine/threonine protein kinase
MSKLGEGAYGSVTKQKNLAVKKFSKLSHIIQEQIALVYLNNCDYLVHSKNVNYNTLELSMDLYDMSLRKWITNDVCCCDECFNKILHDILCGLVELQDRGLSHSDIKPGNILIQKDPLKAVLGDCGFVSIAKYSKQQRTALSHRDLVIENDDKHDMFSFGVIMLELLYNVKPTVKETYKEYHVIIKKRVKNQIHYNLLKKLLNENRIERPSAREVLSTMYKEHPENFISKKINIHHIVDSVCEKYGKTKLKSYELLMKNTLDVNRSRKGYNALLVYLHNNNVNIKYINYYFVAMLLVLSSVFNTRSANINYILDTCNMKINKKKLNDVLYEITNNIDFVNTIFS